MSTLINVAPDGGRKVSPHVGLTSDVPLNNTQNEVSVRYAPNPMKNGTCCEPLTIVRRKPTIIF